MTWQFFLKVAITVVVVIAVSEISKRSSLWGAILASLPLTSLLAFIGSMPTPEARNRLLPLSRGIFWLVLASLPLFALLPFLLGSGWSFWPSLLAACVVTIGAYFA
jgi:hypothetical protein